NRPSQTASATGCSCGTSSPENRASRRGSHRMDLAPSKHSPPPGIDVGDHDGSQEDKQLDEDDVPHLQRDTVRRVSGGRPGVKKQQLNIENEKEDGDQIKLDV